MSYQLQYIEKHDHPTWMTVSKLKNNIFNYKKPASAAKNIPILFVYLGITITYICNTFSQLRILLIVAWCAEQTQFGIVSNTLAT